MFLLSLVDFFYHYVWKINDEKCYLSFYLYYWPLKNPSSFEYVSLFSCLKYFAYARISYLNTLSTKSPLPGLHGMFSPPPLHHNGVYHYFIIFSSKNHCLWKHLPFWNETWYPALLFTLIMVHSLSLYLLCHPLC